MFKIALDEYLNNADFNWLSQDYLPLKRALDNHAEVAFKFKQQWMAYTDQEVQKVERMVERIVGCSCENVVKKVEIVDILKTELPTLLKDVFDDEGQFMETKEFVKSFKTAVDNYCKNVDFNNHEEDYSAIRSVIDNRVVEFKKDWKDYTDV